MQLEFEASKNSKSLSDYQILEQLCRGAYQFRDGETIHSVLTRLFQRYDYHIHTRFKFYKGRSPLAYAALFGQVEVVRMLAEKCCGNVHKLDNVSSPSTLFFGWRFVWYFGRLQNGYSIIRTACLSGHLPLVKTLVEEYKCSLNHLWWRSSGTHIVDRQCDEHQFEYLGRKIEVLLKDMFGNNCGNNSLKKYLLDVTKARRKERKARRKELKGMEVPRDSIHRKSKCIGSEQLKLDCRSTLLQLSWEVCNHSRWNTHIQDCTVLMSISTHCACIPQTNEDSSLWKWNCAEDTDGFVSSMIYRQCQKCEVSYQKHKLSAIFIFFPL